METGGGGGHKRLQPALQVQSEVWRSRYKVRTNIQITEFTTRGDGQIDRNNGKGGKEHVHGRRLQLPEDRLAERNSNGKETARIYDSYRRKHDDTAGGVCNTHKRKYTGPGHNKLTGAG